VDAGFDELTKVNLIGFQKQRALVSIQNEGGRGIVCSRIQDISYMLEIQEEGA
jgi:hypothetical protein